MVNIYFYPTYVPFNIHFLALLYDDHGFLDRIR